MLQDERSKIMTTQKHQTEYVVRCLFERFGDCSYIGHLDLMHVFDRAVRRADMPMLYSQGYNPRPMIVFALPLGVGIHTAGDYVDISLAQEVDAGKFMSEVNPQLPSGVKILKAINIPEPKNSLMSVVTAAKYRIEAPDIKKFGEKLFDFDELLTTKKSKGKTVETDIRPLLLSKLQCPSDDPNVFEFYCCAGSTKNLRPDILLNALSSATGYDVALANDAKVVRTALYGGEYPKLLDIMTLL